MQEEEYQLGMPKTSFSVPEIVKKKEKKKVITSLPACEFLMGPSS